MVNVLVSQLHTHVQQQFTGRLDVIASQTNWSIFFCLGRLVWAKGGIHHNRRFHRLWRQYCASVTLANIKLRDDDKMPCYYYHVLSVLSRRQILTPQQTKAMIVGLLQEVLFDILQQQELETLTYEVDAQGGIDKSLTLMANVIGAELLVPSSQKHWSEWKASGLTAYSPNLVPLLTKSNELKQQTKPETYQTLCKLVNGKNSLREVSALLKKDLQKLTLSIIPYVRKGFIELREMPDQQRVPNSPALIAPASQTKTVDENKLPLIACVDDSVEICNKLEQILKKGGYRFVGIQDSVQALPILIGAKPELIILDLVMPIANGYEICTQLRRVSMFETIPILILTGNDGVVDRVRAKMVGANGYMTKPIEPKKVLAVIKRFLELAKNPQGDTKSGSSEN